MISIKKRKFRFTKRLIVHIITLLMLVYFIFHSVYGSRGIISYFQLKSELKNAHVKLEQLRSQRLEVENRTKLLRPDSLDKDMLDEKVRNTLGLSKPEEKIFSIK